jgi:hypothetical protein
MALQEAPRHVGGLSDVDGHHANLSPALAHGALQPRQLFPALGAPARPEVDHERVLALAERERRALTVRVLDLERGVRRAEPEC